VNILSDLTVKHNKLSAEEFISLWESVWGGAPSPEQTRLAMEHTLFRVSVFDGDRIVAMARVIGDMGLDYYIKDVIVRPEYQGRGIGRLMINEILRFINDHGVEGTDIFVELCAMPDKIPFYEKFGFSANEAQRLRLYHRVEHTGGNGNGL
jgi:GNAT superfamily N-acetyltransferase